MEELVDPDTHGHSGVTVDDYLAEWGTRVPYAVVAPSGKIAVWVRPSGLTLPAVYRNPARARDAARALTASRVVNLKAVQAARDHHARVPLNPNLDVSQSWREAVTGPYVMAGRLGVWGVDHVRQDRDGDEWVTVDVIETWEFTDETAAVSFARGLAQELPATLLTPDDNDS